MLVALIKPLRVQCKIISSSKSGEFAKRAPGAKAEVIESAERTAKRNSQIHESMTEPDVGSTASTDVGLEPCGTGQWKYSQDPVTTPCGHSFCKVCINGHWDHEDVKGVFSCPQCRETFTPRPVLCRNNMLTEVVEKLKKTELQAASPAHCYTGPGDVECDFCTGRKHKAVKSCLVCQASYCEDHLKPHYQSPAFKKHKLVEACAELQEKICSEHDKLMEIYCRTDQSFICYLCKMEEHKGHETVPTKTERTEK
ncbi:E3 ubiquitin/ISG15 ligase TRIM25-like [Hemibagrus wyckioides]|uniref:E3 ubiquitin/ISG15 ligase TRIM25-like n=1 Tax=Hemibagrus wyckioides TaxID=337641 RepID=UPI00266D0945|nr:E3 ubiquitin/ISG15 ligase TRIM25-like [Hemibagrus wyckioides]